MAGVINTERELEALPALPKRYERAIGKARGLSVLVYANGVKSFVFRYRADNGSRRRILLGDHPALSIYEARIKSGVIRGMNFEGRDPAAERAAARAEQRFGETLEDLATRYWAAAALGLHGGRKRPLRPATIERQKILWNRHLASHVGARRFREFRRADVRAFMQSLVVAGKLSAASVASIGDVLRALYAYALHEDLVEANPTLGLTRPIAPQSRSRLFSDQALSVILRQLHDASNSRDGRFDPHARLEPQMARALRFMIVTLTRRTEAAGARWSEIDLAARAWHIPPGRTKNRQFHTVPLSPEAIEVLHEARRSSASEYIFPSATKANAHLDPHALTRAVRRICSRFELPPGSPHDFRRTGATVLTGERYRVRRFIVGLVLGHTPNDGAAITAVYDRNEYLTEKREALNAWARHLVELHSLPEEPPMPGARGHLRLVNLG